MVLADGRVVACDTEREPELFWGLRGVGGGQFGVVTSMEFATVPTSTATRVELHWPEHAAADLIAAWQDWAPDAHRDLTVDLRVAAEPGRPLEVVAFGAALRGEDATVRLLAGLLGRTDPPVVTRLDGYASIDHLKRSFAPPMAQPGEGLTTRSRSELFARPLPAQAVQTLVDGLTGELDGRRELNVTALGGAYDDVAAEATAYAHRGQRFVLEHVGADGSDWPDRSWRLAHAQGSGGVYVNFPDVALTDGATAYHGPHRDAPVEVKRRYDPDQFFRFPQSVPASPFG